MKNIEKYCDELLNLEGDINCYFTECIMKEECGSKENCDECKKDLIKWLNEEYREPIPISADEKTILRNLPEEFKYIARDSNTDIFIYKTKPTKKLSAWVNTITSNTAPLNLYAHLFQFVKWEDDEPYSIEELLKEDTYEPSR